MKTLKLFLLPVLESFEFAWQVSRYALIFVSAFFRQRASLGCEMVAMRSQLTFYEESILQKRQPRLRFNPAFRLLWVLLSSVWSGWKSATELMKPKTVLKWHEHAFLKWWRWKSRRKGGRPTISQEMRASFVERYGGTLRRELLDHVIVLNEEHLKRLLREFIEAYYHLARPHQGLNGDTPVPSGKPEPAAEVTRLVSIPVVGGLHHRYVRVAA